MHLSRTPAQSHYPRKFSTDLFGYLDLGREIGIGPSHARVVSQVRSHKVRELRVDIQWR
jgi:hypothetical protein